MQLDSLDQAIIIAYFVLVIGVGLLFSKRAGSSLTEFFLSGRSLPWWVAGTSMVATTFAADTPLAVTEMVAKNGLAGNWFWWAFALGGMFTVFVYARLWRRAEVVTDVELIELRYGGRAAGFLRGFRSLYVALLVNSIIIGWVTKAMLTILDQTVFADGDGIGSEWLTIVVMLGIVGVYSTMSGLWGVALTDMLQFVLAMGGCIALAVLAVDHVGGVDALQSRIDTALQDGGQMFRFLPDFSAENPWMPLNVFLIMVFVQWWASWYPGAEPGGGGYIVQRMASCRDERHARLATLWYQIAHYCIRPWPWLMVAFVALAVHPEIRTWATDDDPATPGAGAGFPMMIRELAPSGLRGLMLVAFAAAFMSTISTQMNWGASYLVNDVYRRFLRPDADDRQLARASRLASVIVLLAGGIAAWFMRDTDISKAWGILLALGAGTGAVFMLRWFWWRINAWSEIVAMVASLVFYLVVNPRFDKPQHVLAIVAGLTMLAWLVATFVTRPEQEELLIAFYRKVHPGGPGWRPIARRAPEVIADSDLTRSILTAIVASGIVYCTIPGIGALIFGDSATAFGCLGGALGCAIGVALLLRRSAEATTATGERPD